MPLHSPLCLHNPAWTPPKPRLAGKNASTDGRHRESLGERRDVAPRSPPPPHGPTRLEMQDRSRSAGAIAAAAKKRHGASSHRYGKLCVGVITRSLGGEGRPASFLRPCQTLEACEEVQTLGPARRVGIPEAEVVRAALHMLQGLPGNIFVRTVGRSGEGGSTGGPAGRIGRFALSASATRELAVMSLSPEALASVLGDFVRVGCVAEYLRAFVADAEASALATDGSGEVLAPTGGPSAPATAEGTCKKHGYTTQAFAACVRLELEAFEVAVARRDSWLYRRQRGNAGAGRGLPGVVDDAPGNTGEQSPRESPSGETLLGLLELLRDEARSLERMMELVERGAGWWHDIPGGSSEGAGVGADELRARTGRLLAVLYDAVVADAAVGHPVAVLSIPSHVSPGMAPRASRRCGWLLHLFGEVLAPYLRLMDAWVSEGRIEDPHGELFFSRIDALGAERLTAQMPRVGEPSRYGERRPPHESAISRRPHPLVATT